MTDVLVTGAAGFIGSHLCDRLLAEGRTVVGVDDLSRGRIANLSEARRYPQRFTFHQLDIRAEGLATLVERTRPEIVMHLAAQSGVRPSIEHPRHDADVNVLGLLNVLEACAVSRVRKVVFASSGGTIYGEPRRIPVKESSIGSSKPLSPYGITKKVADDYLRYYRRERGVDYTSLALGNVYGPRQDPFGEAGVIAIFAARMLGGESPAIFGDGNQTRDYVFIDDTVHAFAKSIEAGSGKLVNVGTGVETSVNTLYSLLARITRFSGEASHGRLPAGELRRISLDNALAETALGWKPWTHVEDGLAETVVFLKGT